MIDPRALSCLAAACALVGVVARMAPPLQPSAPVVPSAIARPVYRSSVTRGSAAVYDAVIATDIFSAARRPPADRFRPADQPAPALVVRHATVETPRPHLFGITVTPRGAIALIGTTLCRVGDRIGGGSITAISDSTVVLVRAGGRVVLRLPSVTTGRR